jgi:hypothetical protein
MSEVYKRELVFLVAGLVAAVMIVTYFLDIPVLNGLAQQLQVWALIIQLMAIGLGAINLVRVNYRHMQQKTEGLWIFSAWFMVLFAIMLLLGLVGLSTGSENAIYSWVFANVYTSLSSTLYAITGFYIFSAAYRAFRARNIDAAILLIGGVFVILANAPVGAVIWKGFPIIGGWFNISGQVPAMRTFTITGALGLLAYGFRTLLGKESGFYGEAGQ